MALFGFSPNAQRTVVVGTCGIGAATGIFQTINAAAGELDFWFDLSEVCAAAGGSAVVAVSAGVVSALSTPPAVNDQGTDGTFACLVLEGFTTGDEIEIALNYTLANGAGSSFTASLSIDSPAGPQTNTPPINLSEGPPVNAGTITMPQANDQVLVLRGGQIFAIELSDLATGIETGAQIDGYAIQANNQDILFTFSNGNTYMATGMVQAIGLANDKLVYARQAKPSGVGTAWNDGTFVQLSNGLP